MQCSRDARLLDALPAHARALVFVDGPKGSLGLKLALAALPHPRVAMVALHDVAEVWGKHLNAELQRHNETLLMTSEPYFRKVRRAASIARHGLRLSLLLTPVSPPPQPPPSSAA